MLQYKSMDTSLTQPTSLDQIQKDQHKRPSWRTFALQVIVPLIVGILVIAAGIVFLWQGGIGTLSAWADTSLILLMVPWLCLGLVPIALIGALWYGVFKLTAWIATPLRSLRSYIDKAQGYIRKAADVAVQPILVVKGIWAVVTTFFEELAAFFGIDDGDTYE